MMMHFIAEFHVNNVVLKTTGRRNNYGLMIVTQAPLVETNEVDTCIYDGINANKTMLLLQ